MDAWISFTSTQKADGIDDKFEFDLPAEYQKTDDGYKLIYDESEVMGVSHMITTLTTNNNGVIIDRRGEFNILLVLEEGRRTTLTYKTQYGDMIMGVYAKKINSNLSEHGGKISMHYDLNMPPSHNLNHEVNIEVKLQNERIV